jgi:hypothetical protein
MIEEKIIFSTLAVEKPNEKQAGKKVKCEPIQVQNRVQHRRM